MRHPHLAHRRAERRVRHRTPAYADNLRRIKRGHRIPRAVLIDGLSVGHYPENSRLNGALILAALHFYRTCGLSVCVLLPAEILPFSSMSPRDLGRLHALRARGLLAVIPRGCDYDSFLLRSAILRGADIVSNRSFENVLLSQRDAVLGTASLSVYLRSHLVPFAFVLGLFVANPDRHAIANGLHAPRAMTH